MPDPSLVIAVASMSLAGLVIASAVALRGWQDWLSLKRIEIGGRVATPPRSAVARIEVADLKERVRKLEAIANGIDY